MRIRAAWMIFGLVLSAARLSAQAPPLSDEFIANTYSTNSQSAPDVAANGKDGFVVVWDSSSLLQLRWNRVDVLRTGRPELPVARRHRELRCSPSR